MVALRFPRLYAVNHGERRSSRLMGNQRLWSPNPGNSILITSAPHSSMVADA